MEDPVEDCAVMTYGDVIDAIGAAPKVEQDAVAATIRKIDFVDGDVCHYLRFLASCMVKVADGGR